MLIEADRDVLLEKAQAVLRVVSPRATLPVLGGVRITASGSEVELAGTDLEIFVTVRQECAVQKAGAMVVPGRLFGDVLKSLPSGKVTVEVRGAQIRVEGARAEFSLTALPMGDFPEFADVPEQAHSRVSATDLGKALRQVVRAASSDEARPILTGVLWSFSEGTARLAATDSYRLAVRELGVKEGPSEGEVIVPSRALSELGRHLAGAGATEATLRMGESQAVCELGAMRLITRLIEGEFPKYRQLIPQGYSSRLAVGRAELLEAVQRVGVVAGANTPVKVHLGEEVRLTAVEAGVGEAAEVLENASYVGEPATMAFNPRFLSDGLEVLEGDKVVMEVGEPTRPAILTGDGGAEFLYLVMPVRLAE
ncbi:MAG: DNA polymerase III subunit beta [Actinomycetota bacterium]